MVAMAIFRAIPARSNIVKKTSQKNSNGIALIIVMIAVAVFSALAAALAFSMKVETKLARNAENEQQLLWLGRSGVEYARWILSQHPPAEPYDSLNQIWAGGPGGPSETNSPLAGISMDNFKIGDGTVSLKIVDLERFANINTAPAAELQQALTVMGVDADDISVVSDSVQDWRSPAAPPRVAGAESDYYQSLTPPYNAKNAPIDDISELLLIKGVTPEMYYGSGLLDSPNQQKPKLGFGVAPGQAPDYPFGLKDVFTAVSSGKINVNTADVNVLQLIPGVDTNSAAAIIQQRAGPDGVDATEDDTPFRNASAALQAAGLNAANTALAANLVTVGSSTWRVNITAQIGDAKREFTAILYRGTGAEIQVVGFYWK
jgi:general secretion pathway protein K